MNRTTRARLRALNRQFYERTAEAFSASREHSWPGWERIPLPTGRDGSRPLRVLDVGCGNGRYAAALRVRLGHGFAYTGVDESESMLADASRRLALLDDVDARLQRLDVLADDAGRELPAGPFEQVVAFGLLHHVPGRALRRTLLAALADRVAGGGVLVIAAWQFADRPRFASRSLPWSTLASRGATPIDTSDLEPGDHLLAFGEPADALRYCHHCDDAELDDLVHGLPLRESARFSADGRGDDLNRYVVLERAGATASP